MLDWSIDFESPRYLLLLVLLPVFWLIGRRSLQALGTWRRHVALLMRLVVAGLLIAALAEPNWLTLVRRMTVLFVIDASDSIQQEELASALRYVNAASAQRNEARGDRAGVLVFGREAGVEIPPLDQAWQLPGIESTYDPSFTNLDAALRLAAATFPAGSAKRVVLVSDGNENLGQARPQATKLLESGVGIDSVPISYERQGEVIVEKVAGPSDVRRGTPFSVRVVLNNLAPRTVSGQLRVTREFEGAQQVVAEEAVSLEPGKRAFTMRQELARAGMSTYEARFVPDDATSDTHNENNVATSFSRVSGRGQVLLIEDVSQAGRFDAFVTLLRENDIEVTVRNTRRPFDNLADLQQFDCVLLADVARVADDGPADLTQFTDQQIHQLVQNTEHFGSGLVMLGGPNSFGAGGWTSTELEKALPVDCQIDSAKVYASGALMLVIDRSGSMQGEKIVWSKTAAKAAADMLGPRDYIGVVAFDSESQWVVPLQPNRLKNRTRRRIGQLAASGGTNMMPALREAYRAIQGKNASLKHVIVLTDGQTPKDQYATLVSEMKGQGITTTGVAVGPDADRRLLIDISRRGGGKYYHVRSPKAIPKIFMREARRVAMPLVFEDKNGISTQLVTANEMTAGVEPPIPPITGYVLTKIKQDPLVEVLLATPRKPAPNSTILATRQYGLGRTVALTTDVGQRWASDWIAWDQYDQMMLQMIRWAMRSHDMNDQLVLSTETRDGAIQVVVNALDRDDMHLNMLSLVGTAVRPDGETQDFSLDQTAPGRYVASLPADEPGNYFLSISSGGRNAPLRTAVSVARTAELDRLASYDQFLAELSEAPPQDGEPGQMIRAPGGIDDTDSLLATDVFRPGIAPAITRDRIWPLVLLVAGLVFLSDVFCRRVQVNFHWIPALASRLPLLRRRPEPAQATPIDRLKATKAGATARYEHRGVSPEEDSGFRIQDSGTLTSDSRILNPSPKPDSETAQPAAGLQEDEDTSFTERLLEAKRRVRNK